MIFADNLFEIYVPTDAKQPFIQFNAYDALKMVDSKNLPNIMVRVFVAKVYPFILQVHASETWQKARADSLPEIPYPFDWTFTSHYCGTVPENARIESTDETINLDKLMRRDPILFYDAITLYEDELDDNGSTEVSEFYELHTLIEAQMTIKVRVMESNFFVLCRFYLRVDQVIVRVHDCRLYGEEGWNYMLRESTVREAFYKDIASEVSQRIQINFYIFGFSIISISWIRLKFGSTCL